MVAFLFKNVFKIDDGMHCMVEDVNNSNLTLTSDKNNLHATVQISFVGKYNLRKISEISQQGYKVIFKI